MLQRLSFSLRGQYLSTVCLKNAIFIWVDMSLNGLILHQKSKRTENRRLQLK